LFPIWGDDAGKAGKLLFARKEVFPLSPRPSHPFKKSGKTFLFTFTYLCREQRLSFYLKYRKIRLFSRKSCKKTAILWINTCKKQENGLF